MSLKTQNSRSILPTFSQKIINHRASRHEIVITVDHATQTELHKNKNKKSASMESINVIDQIEKNRIQTRIEILCQKVYLSQDIGLSWFKALEPEFSKPYFRKLSASLKKSKHHIPPVKIIYYWTTLCDPHNVKVVILGEPYPNLQQVTGLCYSVPKGENYPATLSNIFKEVESDIKFFQAPTHGDLSGWAKQGVLLLNIQLTSHRDSRGKPDSWVKFVSAVIKWLSTNLNGIVFLLWGLKAQLKAKLIDTSKHHILIAAHPQPKTARRGFFGCNHFSKTNKILSSQGKCPIDWNAL